MTTYTVTAEFATSVFEIANPWFIVNADYVVGVYAGRAAARTAKATGLAGKVVSLSEVELKVVEESKPTGFEVHGLTHCPSCGVHLNNGVGIEGQEVNGKCISHKEFEFCCLACETEFGPAIPGKRIAIKRTVTKTKTKVFANHSSVDKPCRLVWDLADAMNGARRKDVIAAAEAKGVAFYTARTQYQLWVQVQKEMANRDFNQNKV